jgi:hypothetical protein
MGAEKPGVVRAWALKGVLVNMAVLRVVCRRGARMGPAGVTALSAARPQKSLRRG